MLLQQVLQQLLVRVVANAANVVMIANARSLLTQSVLSLSTVYQRLLRVDVASHSQLS
jgi:hypothetical protein